MTLTPQTKSQALYRLIEAYLSLGLRDDAYRVLQVAEYNYPESVWTRGIILIDDPDPLPHKAD